MNTSFRNFEDISNVSDLDLDFMLVIDEDQLNKTSRIDFAVHEQIIFGLQWFLIQVFGNGLLIGLIQFDRHGGDPLKRRITDQVRI